MKPHRTPKAKSPKANKGLQSELVQLQEVFGVKSGVHAVV